MRSNKRPAKTRARRTSKHVCATSVKAGDRITLAGRVVGYQPIEAIVLAIECEGVVDERALRRRRVVEHRPMLVVEDVESIEAPLPPPGFGARVRGHVKLQFVWERPGEEGMMTRTLTIEALRAWAMLCPVHGMMSQSLLDDLIEGTL